MRTWAAAGLAAGIGLAVGLAPVGYWSLASVRFRNLRVVDAGNLYRSGALSAGGLERAVRELGIRTVVSLRDRKDDTGAHDDQDEADFCRAHGVAFHRLSPADWTPVGGVVPGDRTVREFLRILDDPATGRPVLVHCFAGIHRTGAHVAVYRMEYQGWSAAEAVAEMRRMGTPRTTFADNLLNYLSGYRPGRLRAPCPIGRPGGRIPDTARVAELADAPDLGSGTR